MTARYCDWPRDVARDVARGARAWRTTCLQGSWAALSSIDADGVTDDVGDVVEAWSLERPTGRPTTPPRNPAPGPPRRNDQRDSPRATSALLQELGSTSPRYRPQVGRRLSVRRRRKTRSETVTSRRKPSSDASAPRLSAVIALQKRALLNLAGMWRTRFREL